MVELEWNFWQANSRGLNSEEAGESWELIVRELFLIWCKNVQGWRSCVWENKAERRAQPPSLALLTCMPLGCILFTDLETRGRTVLSDDIAWDSLSSTCHTFFKVNKNILFFEDSPVDLHNGGINFSPGSPEEGFLFLHILSNIRYWVSWWQPFWLGWGGISR